MFTHKKPFSVNIYSKFITVFAYVCIFVNLGSAVNYKYLEQVRQCVYKIDHGNFGPQMKNIDKVRAISEDVSGNLDRGTRVKSELSGFDENGDPEDYSEWYDENCVCDEQIRIIIILDETSSMKQNIDVTIEKYNEFLYNQKYLNLTEYGEFISPKLTLVKFSSTFSITRVDSLYDAKNLNERSYVPSGSTALYDAIGCTINAYNKESNNILVIITDGAENSSSIFSKMQVKKLTDRVEKDRGWEIQYLGANQDSFVLAGGIGIAKARNFRANSDGFTEIFNKLHKDLSRSRSDQFTRKAESINDKMAENRKIYKKIRRGDKVIYRRKDSFKKRSKT